jgi:uncharacterized membrane protein YfcA
VTSRPTPAYGDGVPSHVSLLTFLLLLSGGIAGGFINTVAGGGSVITVPILVEVVGAGVANGTLRVAILLQGLSGVTNYHRGGAVPWRRIVRFIPPMVAGAVGGAWVATLVSPEGMRRAFAIAVLLVAISVLFKPSRWTGMSGDRLRQPWASLAYLAVGFYGGFIQVGVGFLLLAALVLGTGFDLVKGNAAKMVLVLSYGPVVIFLFARAAQVDWAAGVVLGVGSMIGAFIASTLAIRKGADWIRWVLVVAAVGAATRMLLV